MRGEARGGRGGAARRRNALASTPARVQRVEECGVPVPGDEALAVEHMRLAVELDIPSDVRYIERIVAMVTRQVLSSRTRRDSSP